MQQLEKTYERTDRERVEAVLSSRQLQEQLKVFEGLLSEERERAGVLDAELAEASAAALVLQSTVNRLRGKLWDDRLHIDNWYI